MRLDIVIFMPILCLYHELTDDISVLIVEVVMH